MKQLLILSCFVIALSFSISAQETISTSGGEATGAGGTASYTVGQVFYQTHSGDNGSVAEGVQQPFEISVVTEIESIKGVELNIAAYPNPTTDVLILSVGESDFSDMSYQLFDVQGRILQNRRVENSETSINMKDFTPANYFVKVIKNKTEIKVFKIVKR